MGKVKSGVNRPSDVGETAPDFQRLDIAPSRQMMKILTLLQLDQSFDDDDLPYGCFPEPTNQYYNSNSYAAGLLEAAGLLPVGFIDPVSELYPGWFKPVPTGKFQ